MNTAILPVHRILIIIISWLLLQGCAATKFRMDKTPLDHYLEKSSIFEGSHSGLLVYDPESKSTVFDYHSEKKFIPASNTKLLTYYSMLSMLGDSIPGMEYCYANDTLYFTTTGDPTLLYENFEHSTSYDFLQDHKGPLVYIEKQLEDQRLGPGWAWDDYPYYYSAERSAFPIYGNMVRFSKMLDQDQIQITPSYFEFSIRQLHDENIDDVRIDRNETSNEYLIRLSGSNPITVEDELPFIYSKELFVQLLSDTLHREVLLQDGFPNCQKETLYSVPTDSVAKYILTISDNFLSEQMLLVISNELGDTLNSAKSIEHLLEHQLSEIKDEVRWVDGSGLSRYNLLSPRALVLVLDKISQTVPEEKLYQLLPESGASGTLKRSFSNLDGRIHAKTGSMSNVYNLSGYLDTKSGKTLLFSFMNNGYLGDSKSLKEAMEKVLSVFYSKY